MIELPIKINRVGVPPLKCQGIKTKLIPFIFSNIRWKATLQDRWIEPFLGSSAVALNLAPQKALLADTNQYIIQLYQEIQRAEITPIGVREFLFCEGKKLEMEGADYYYKVRQRFNEQGSPLDFLFLNRACFNGVMRFNRQGNFNVPFGHKPQRFSPAYITKIVNQISWAAKQMQGKDWEFRVASWADILTEAQAGDFVYLDPPYIGRHVDYYNSWDETEALKLADCAKQLPCGFALSMWLENCYRKNAHIEQCWSDLDQKTYSHFYYVGSYENLRNSVNEALLIKPGFAVQDETGQLQD